LNDISQLAAADLDPEGRPERRSAGYWPRKYGLAFLFVALALLFTLGLQRLQESPVLFMFFAAVMAAAWFGGPGPGLFAVLASTIVVDYFFVPPLHSFAINATDITYFASFVIFALAASWVSSAKREDEEALREARDQLEIRVAERTAELQKSNTELHKTLEEHDAAQEELMQTQAELAELSRFLTMTELTASIAHEVNQPLTAVAVYGRACLEWLSTAPPNLEEARRAAEIVIQDGTRAGAILNRIRALFKRQPVVREWLNMNDAIREAVAFANEEASRQHILIRMELDNDLPKVKGDLIQLQQVVLNLVINAMDSLRETDGRREIVIGSCVKDAKEVLVGVEDSGKGLSADIAQRIFDPFFTTKAQGIGMGLSISRSIVESHGGRLWAEARETDGARFQFTVRVNE
jgi:C4-dicarboxylate-specific signal transduction histidine kinase